MFALPTPYPAQLGGLRWAEGPASAFPVPFKAFCQSSITHRNARHSGHGSLSSAAVPARTAEAAVAAQASGADPSGPAGCVYSGVVFDMDGTLTQSNIDYVAMRERIGIPRGDLFTVMESWDDGDQIRSSMDVILELEAQARLTLEAMPSVREVLSHLQQSNVRVGLVTRNTPAAVDAFFALIGEEYRGVFDIVLTREFKHVKPDKRCLTHFAKEWGLPAHTLLMVGDSPEDVETGNAAGTATAFISGGGNEVGGGPAPPAPGAVPTFTVASLEELLARLAAGDTALGWGAYGIAAASRGSSDSEGEEDAGGAAAAREGLAGAPPPGMGFLDALFLHGAVRAAQCSFPRIDGTRFGVPPDTHPGDRVLHLGCGDGALTKMLVSSGLQVVGVDDEVGTAQRRGLVAEAITPMELSPGALDGSLGAAAVVAGRDAAGAYDAVLFHVHVGAAEAAAVAEAGPIFSGVEAGWASPRGLAEVRRVLKRGGRYCVEARVADPVATRDALGAAGFGLCVWESLGGEEGAPARGAPQLVRMIATV